MAFKYLVEMGLTNKMITVKKRVTTPPFQPYKREESLKRGFHPLFFLTFLESLVCPLTVGKANNVGKLSPYSRPFAINSKEKNLTKL